MLPHEHSHDSADPGCLELVDVSHVDAVLLELVDLIEGDLIVILLACHGLLFLSWSLVSGLLVLFGSFHE
jgi:hypothetical protein